MLVICLTEFSLETVKSLLFELCCTSRFQNARISGGILKDQLISRISAFPSKPALLHIHSSLFTPVDGVIGVFSFRTKNYSITRECSLLRHPVVIDPVSTETFECADPRAPRHPSTSDAQFTTLTRVLSTTSKASACTAAWVPGQRWCTPLVPSASTGTASRP